MIRDQKIGLKCSLSILSKIDPTTEEIKTALMWAEI